MTRPGPLALLLVALSSAFVGTLFGLFLATQVLAALPATSEALRAPATAGGGSSAASLVPVAPPINAAGPVRDWAGGATQPSALTGTATYYCRAKPYSRCTRGYQPSDLVAAIDPTTGIRKGTRLRVTSGGRSVTVVVVDVCSCKGDRIIDLTSGAFSRLSPLSAGRIAVTLERVAGGPLPTPPSTDVP